MNSFFFDNFIHLPIFHLSESECDTKDREMIIKLLKTKKEKLVLERAVYIFDNNTLYFVFCVQLYWSFQKMSNGNKSANFACKPIWNSVHIQSHFIKDIYLMCFTMQALLTNNTPNLLHQIHITRNNIWTTSKILLWSASSSP